MPILIASQISLLKVQDKNAPKAYKYINYRFKVDSVNLLKIYEIMDNHKLTVHIDDMYFSSMHSAKT